MAASELTVQPHVAQAQDATGAMDKGAMETHAAARAARWNECFKRVLLRPPRAPTDRNAGRNDVRGVATAQIVE